MLLAFALAVAVLGPMLRPGSPLRYDLVSVPRPVLTPDALGLGDRLPRAVPLDAASWLLGQILGGWVSQGLALTALLLAGWGAARLVGGRPGWSAGRMVATVVAVCNPFVLEQLAIGHVPHLVSYGVLPWAALAGHRLASGRAPALPAAAGLSAVLLLGSLTPGGGLLCAGAALAGLLVGGRRRGGRLVAGGLLVAIAQTPWLVAGLAHPGLRSGTGPADRADVGQFAVRAETSAGRTVDVLGLGGMWNAAALPASRHTVLALLSTMLLIGLALIGLWVAVRDPARRPALVAGGVLAAAGYLIALLPVLPGGSALLARLVQSIPAAGLLRDGHRWLAWPAIGIAVLCGYATDRIGAGLAGRYQVGVPAAQVVLPAAAAVLLSGLVVATVPDLFGAVAGRLTARQYPADWATARTTLAAATDSSRLLVLPWQPFRRFDWTAAGTVLDPAPRYLPREAVVSDALRVGGRTLPEEGPLARQLAAALADDRLTEPELRSAAIGWVLIERGTPGRLPVLPTVVPVLDGPDLQLSRLPGALPEPVPVPAGRRNLVLIGLVLPGVATLGLTAVAFGSLIRGQRRRRLLGYPPVIERCH